MDIVKDQGDEALYDKLDSSYPSEDEESEVCVYLISYNCSSNRSNILPLLLLYFSQEVVDDAYLNRYGNENENSVYSINKGVGAFYDKLVSVYSTEDEESEVWVPLYFLMFSKTSLCMIYFMTSFIFLFCRTREQSLALRCMAVKMTMEMKVTTQSTVCIWKATLIVKTKIQSLLKNKICLECQMILS